MGNKIVSLALGLALLSAMTLQFVKVAEAATVFNNGGPLTNALGWDATGHIEADNFGFASDTTVRNGTVYFYDDFGPWDGTFEWSIYANAPTGSPGNLLSSGNGSNVNVSNSGLIHSNGSVIRELTFDLETPFDASAGINYWLGVHLAGDFNRVNVRWALSSVVGTGNHHFSSAGGPGLWFPGRGEFAFSLGDGVDVAPVPLPAAAWLFLTALGSMGVLGWRRKRTATA